MSLDNWRYVTWFRQKEFLCKHCQREEMDLDFLHKLDALRGLMGRPLIISSGYRCPQYNQLVSSTGNDGPHTTGHAADILIAGEQAYVLLQRAMDSGVFTGVGISQKGDVHTRFIHLDDLKGSVRPRVWTY